MNNRACKESPACGYLATCAECDGCDDCCRCPGNPMFCECCGGGIVECSCEWGEVYCIDRIEGGEAISPGYYVERCLTHESRE